MAQLSREGVAEPRTHRAPDFAAPNDGHVPPMVPGRLGLLVASVVLLVHDDHTEVRDRGEHGRPGPDGDPHPSGSEGAPGVEPFPVRQARVEHRDQVPESLPEPLQGLGSEGDLRDQDDASATTLEHSPEQLDVDQRLPRPGDPVEKSRLPRPEHPGQAIDGLLLLPCRPELRRRARVPMLEWISEDLLFPDLCDVLGDESRDDRPAEARIEEGGEGEMATGRNQPIVGLSLARAPAEGPVQLLQGAHLPSNFDDLPGLRGRGAGGHGLVAQDAERLQSAHLGPERSLPDHPPHAGGRPSRRSTGHSFQDGLLAARELLTRPGLFQGHQVVSGAIDQRARKHGSEYLTHRRDVVPGQPSAQLQQVPTDRRLLVEHGQDSAHLRNGGSAPQDPPHLDPVPERHHDTASRCWRIPFDGVGERLPQWKRKSDVDQTGAGQGGAADRRVSPPGGGRRSPGVRLP